MSHEYVPLVPPRTPFDRRCYDECTKDVIFLFQRKRLTYLGLPDGYQYGDECGVYEEDDDGNIKYDENDEPIEVQKEELLKMHFGDYDLPCIMQTWETELVFLTREESDAYGTAKHYNYPDGWRTYGVCAKGSLAEIIRHT